MPEPFLLEKICVTISTITGRVDPAFRKQVFWVLYDITLTLLAGFLSPYWPCLLSRWVRTHFGWPRSLVSGSGQVCLGLVADGWSCLTWRPRRPSTHVSWLTPSTVTPDFYPLRKGWVYQLGAEEPFLGECQWGQWHFLEPPGVCRFRPCARTTLKDLVPKSFSWWDVWQIPLPKV